MKSTLLQSGLLLVVLLANTEFSLAQETPKQSKSIQPQAVKIADKQAFRANISDSLRNLSSTQFFDDSDSEKIEIHRQDASFIKVHFSHFSIPAGSEVIVRNRDGSQSHVYQSINSSGFTIDSEAGDDGISRFSAFSIIGDTAIVEYRANGMDNQPYSIDIDYIMEGYPQQELDALSYGAQGEVGIASTCGVNERRDVQCWAASHPTEFERTRPVARLLINGSGLCTAWRVGADNHLFTNNHCIESQSSMASSEIWFNYQRSGCGTGSTNATTIVNGETIFATNQRLDYTLFSVQDFNTIQSFGHFGLEVRNAVLDEQIYIPQHGSGNPKELAIESDQNAGNLCRIDEPEADGLGTNTDMGYFCDTTNGSSGSPVVASSSNNVIALHHFGGCPNQGVQIAEIWPEVASYFNNVIPVGDNGSGDDGGDDGGDDDGGDDSDGELENGVSITNLSGAQSSEQFFFMNVPDGASNLRFVISGGSGDADVYARAGTEPTTSSWDCRPYLDGNSETCQMPADTSGIVYVMIRGYLAYSGLSLVGLYDEDTSPPTPTPDPECINLENVSAFSNTNTGSYVANGCSITLSGNIWRATDATFTITSDSVLTFDFSSNGTGEIHGIAFDSDSTASSNRVFELDGSQNWGITDFSYTGAGEVETLSIPIGQYYTGSNMRLILVNDKDSGVEDNTTTISNVRLSD